ncbi:MULTISPECIES: PIN domain-containing protein [unclassified Methanoregula]|uniref:type II toxin-antitoxin system VapC family toxin n=1 Tax=unclassified Methanoregula TaxID=2649730 RepID=UPI0009CA710F|nr:MULTISPECIES: PIN domain-containing protein [unclassified Methanoregula]OPX62545.1 MAG: PIN domain protein [Methanoregula sp. PtaB.Bin085]OPY31644.1 MAG: PIN domain protein [Methanoregula sp. PtaU1.Bin006]
MSGGINVYLIDTNIFLEYILKRQHVREVRDFFYRVDPALLHMTDFSLHTLGVIYLREQKAGDFLTFINEDILASGIRILSLDPDNFAKIAEVSTRFHLDFDDAYQYTIADLNNLTIVSYDRDFDRTEKGRREPQDLLT